MELIMRHQSFKDTSAKPTEKEWYQTKFKSEVAMLLADVPKDIRHGLSLESDEAVYDNMASVVLVGSVRLLNNICNNNLDNPVTLNLTYSGKEYIKLIYAGLDDDPILNACKKDIVEDLKQLKSFPETIELTCVFDVKNLNTVVGYTMCDKDDANKVLTDVMYSTILKSSKILTEMALQNESEEKRNTVVTMLAHDLSAELSNRKNVLLTTCSKFLQRYIDSASKITVVDETRKCNFSYSVEAVERLLSDRLKLVKEPLALDYTSEMESVLSTIEYSK